MAKGGQACAVCKSAPRQSRTVLCASCVSRFIREAVDASRTLFERVDPGSRALSDEKKIDGTFYFDVICFRWREEVKELSLKIFGSVNAPGFGADPEEIRPLPDPFESVRRRAYSILEDASSWQS